MKPVELDDISFQQRLWQAPNELDESMQAYLEAHPEKIELVKQAKQFDEQLTRTMDVDVPEGLHARILMKNTFETASELSTESEPNKQTVLSWNVFSKWTALAASFMVLAIGLSLYDYQWGRNVPQILQNNAVEMENAVLQHIVEHTTDHPEIMAKNAPEPGAKELQRIFKYVGATLHKPIDFMSYAGQCEVDGQKGLHIVLQEEAGPVTIIVLPHRQLNGMYTFAQNGLKGQIIPVRGAVVAIVGATDKQLAMAQMHFFKAVSFG
ncbi:DUF3379 family protein [Hydrogenovibrio kuenenii]|uniref:DUF3379 family protein n=1 Tax=Hydrogenovibrio kuenenii TaxID=63658 RepID=UPI000465B294|nr:DUF3379 family protein [Hydrogenovibrio kuenenii]